MLERLLNATLRFSIARRWLIVAAAVGISFWGVLAVGQMPLDVFPPFAPPQVDVQTSAPGLSPEEVESRISLPIESAVNGIAGVEIVRSSSKAGLSIVQVVFDQKADIYRARQSVAERVQQVSPQLPANAGAPELSPLVSPLGTILQVAFTLKGDGATSLMDLQQLVLRSYRQSILAVPGVAQVTIYGGDEQQFQVLLDPQELQVQNVSLQAVMEGVGSAMATSPGGFLIGGGQERLIRPLAQITHVGDLADVAVRNGQGQPVLLSTLAQVQRGAALKRGDASFNGQPAVVLMVTKQPDVDTPTVTQEVEQRLAELNRTLPADVQVQQTFRQSNFIDSAIRNVSESLLQGVVIVSVVIVLFLMNWRAAVISLSAIPLSLLIGLMLMKALGLGINTMTLGGLVVAIGSVVDDSIVDMENCYRGLRSNQASSTPKSPLKVVFDTSVQVRQPVLFSTVIIAVVFAPIFSLTGVEGNIFAPMGLAYLLCIGSSTLVAVTLSPALCAILLAPVQLPQETTWLALQAERLYRPILALVLETPLRVLASALALVVATCLILPSLGRVFLPEFREQSLVNSMVLYPGVSLEMTNRAGLALTRELQNNPLFSWVQVRSGRAPGDADGAGVNLAHVDVELSERALANRPAAIAELRQAFAKRCRKERPAKGGVLSCFTKWHFSLLRRAGGSGDPLLPVLAAPAELAPLRDLLQAELRADGLGGGAAAKIALWLEKEAVRAATKLARRLRRKPGGDGDGAAAAVVTLQPGSKAGVTDVGCGDVVLQLSDERLASLRRAHAASAGGGGGATGDQHVDEPAFARALFVLLLRYQAVDGGGFQCALPRAVFACLRQHWGVECEGFASPLNCQSSGALGGGRFCSAFADTDAPFGSRGSFFELPAAAATEGSFELNPPFSAELYEALLGRCSRLLEAAEAAGKALSYVLVLGATEVRPLPPLPPPPPRRRSLRLSPPLAPTRPCRRRASPPLRRRRCVTPASWAWSAPPSFAAS